MKQFALSGTLIGLLMLSPSAHGWPLHRRDKLVWQQTYKNNNNPKPDATTWNYDQGGNGWGNKELETYCAYNSSDPPCDPSQPNASIGDGYLHIVARKSSAGHYTSGRLLSQGLRTFKYGRIEARLKIPAGQGIWPAFWMLGEDLQNTPWPGCGEIDIMEVIGKQPGTLHGTLHGSGFPPAGLTATASLPHQAPFFAGFHRYGMIWSPGKIQFYLDNPHHPYATITPADLPPGASWPFDGRRFFLLLNVAAGGAWPGNPDNTTHFPAELLVDSIKVWDLQP